MLRIPAVYFAFIGIAISQTTQASFSGEILDSIDGHAVAGAAVDFEHIQTGLLRRAAASPNGDFAVLSLPPGSYSIRVSAPGYQPQEVKDFEIGIASLNRRSFSLRPLSDVWEARERRNLQALGKHGILPLIGPDMGAGYDVSLVAQPPGAGSDVPVLSNVVGEAKIRELPIAGRDVYSLVVGLGGINSDSGSGRGLGLTVSGQRPTSSSFRLDGFENDNRLTTGPSALPPEAVDEYRVSLAHFSAEYGGTTGYLANAVTPEAGRNWHGLAYGYLQNDALDANSTIRNREGIPRAASRGVQPGFSVSGPLSRVTGLSVFFEALRSREEGEPQTIELPSAVYIVYTAAGSEARTLLDRIPGAAADEQR